jgi:hypothetical protein
MQNKFEAKNSPFFLGDYSHYAGYANARVSTPYWYNLGGAAVLCARLVSTRILLYPHFKAV